MKTPTAHIESQKNDLAETVIMPGDPNRAKFIVKNFLENFKLVNNLRGVQGYTGFYKGRRISVMASNMGNASMGIYSHELFCGYNVKNIIRVGTCGARSENLNLGDIVLAKTSFTNTNFANLYEKNIHCLDCSKKLLNTAKKTAKRLNLPIFEGNIYCTDSFYDDENEMSMMQKHDCVAAEMESASLYYNAKKFKKNAITLCSVSDHLITGKALSGKARETQFKNMIILALEMCL